MSTERLGGGGSGLSGEEGRGSRVTWLAGLRREKRLDAVVDLVGDSNSERAPKE